MQEAPPCFPSTAAHGLGGRCTRLPHVSSVSQVFTWEVSLAPIPRLVILENQLLSSVYNHFYLCLFKYKGWLVPDKKQAQCKWHANSCRVSVAENYSQYLTGKLSKRREKFRMGFSL